MPPRKSTPSRRPTMRDRLPDGPRTPTGFSLSPAILARLDAWREPARRTRSNAVEYLLERALDAEEAGDPPAA